MAENLPSEKVLIQGIVVAEPDIRQDGVRYIAKVTSFEFQDAKIYMKSGLYPRYEYGDVLSILCTMTRPEPIEDFRYDMYLAKFGVFIICQDPFITVQGEDGGNFIFAYILKVKYRLAHRVNALWHEPYAGFMAGLLYGYRGGLGSLNDLFSRTGVTHIIAISGYNITLISTMLISFLVAVCVPRKKAFWYIILGIAVFVTFVGASASVVRAGIMGSIVLLAKRLGRTSGIFNVLILTASLMTLCNPFVLVWDVGFQLSFLSTAGLVYISPLLEKKFGWMPNALQLRESFIATLSATVMTLPLILSQFGRLSIVSVLVNMLILWVIPPIMMAGFFSVLASLIWTPLAASISWMAWAGMWYIVQIVSFFAHVRFASVSVHVTTSIAIIAYILLCAYLYKIYSRL